MSKYGRSGTGRLNITVRDGVDVNYQVYGEKVGSYFKASVPERDKTVYVNGDRRRSWTISLEDMGTGTIASFKFYKEMYIGRTPAQDQSQVKMVLGGDISVSGMHCRIYETGGRLVIEDLGSTNHTFLNEMMVQQPTEIPLWGTIKVGRTFFRVRQMDKN